MPSIGNAFWGAVSNGTEKILESAVTNAVEGSHFDRPWHFRVEQIDEPTNKSHLQEVRITVWYTSPKPDQPV